MCFHDLAGIHQGAARVHWVSLPCTDFEVTTDAVRVAGVRVPTTREMARHVATAVTERDECGRVAMPLPGELVPFVDWFAALRPPPAVLLDRDAAPDLGDWSTADRHSRELDRWLLTRGWTPEQLVFPIGPEWGVGAPCGVRTECDSAGGAGDTSNEYRLLRLVRGPKGISKDELRAIQRLALGHGLGGPGQPGPGARWPETPPTRR